MEREIGEKSYEDDVSIAPGDDISATEEGTDRIEELSDLLIHGCTEQRRRREDDRWEGISFLGF